MTPEEVRERVRSAIANTDYLQKMREHQAEGYVEIIIAITQGKRPLRMLCTGGGKSIEQACIARTYYEYKLKLLLANNKPTGKILLVGEKNEIIVNALQQFKDIGIPVKDIGIIKAGYKLQLDRLIQIASIPTLAARWEKWELMGCPIACNPNYFDLILFEECFVAGTLVDNTPIEDIDLNSYVTAYDESVKKFVTKRVTRLFKNKAPNKLYKISIGSKSVVCTAGHPFMTKSGWKTADSLTTFDEVLTHGKLQFDLHNLPKSKRHQENQFSQYKRVDSIEVYESGDIERFREVCPDGYVYNLEVEDCHTYVANGMVVHNCHHAPSESSRELWRRYPKAKFIGWSATPEHKRGFVGQFDLIISGKSQIELAHLGYQPYWDAYGLNCPANFSKVKITNTGDFDTKALEKEITNSNALLQGDILPTWQKYVSDKYGIVPTILFARNVAESKHYANEINNAAISVNGKLISAVHIDGTMNKNTIAEAIKLFVSGEATFLVNCLKLTEGFDLATYAKSLNLPLTSIGCVQDLAPTASIKKHKQKVGRARGFKHNGKLIAIYLDHWGAHKEFGSPDCPYEWSLEGSAKNKGKPVKRCPDEDCDGNDTWGCGAVDVPNDASSCPHCGFIFPILIKDERTHNSSENDITAIDRSTELIPIASDLLNTFEQMLATERKPGWAIGQFITYAPDYQTLLAVQQRTNGKISDTFQYWLNGRRIKLNKFDWLPEFEEVLEILILLVRLNKEKRFKNLEQHKPAQTYQSWLRCVRKLKGQHWLPSDDELAEIAKVCEYDPKWAFAQKELLKKRNMC